MDFFETEHWAIFIEGTARVLRIAPRPKSRPDARPPHAAAGAAVLGSLPVEPQSVCNGGAREGREESHHFLAKIFVATGCPRGILLFVVGFRSPPSY
eukprot:scaffold242833_cov34-Tisochrysis_lutea.AAC.1